MPGTLRLGRMLGIDIRVHFSWLFIFLLVAWSLAKSYLPDGYPGWEQRTYWTVGVAGSALLFVCVLIHELSHSVLAVARGYKVSGITLFFLGGVSQIAEEPASAREEFWISVAGPITSVVLAAIFWILHLVTPSTSPEIEALLGYLAFINLVLAVFNLIPAFPLDGGRVLKAAVWQATGSLPQAIAVSTRVGAILGWIAIGVGAAIAVSVSLISGLWIAFVGWFIQSSASAGRQQQVVRNSLKGKTVRDAMQQEFHVVGPGITIQNLVEEHITREFQQAYVVVLGDALQGVVSLADVRGVPREEWSSKYVAEVMTRVSEAVTIQPDVPLEVALQHLVSRDLNQLMVVEGGKPIGLLTRGDVLRVVQISELFPH